MSKYAAQHQEIASDFQSLARVAEIFLNTTDYDNLVQRIVDSVLHEVDKLGHNFHVAVLALADEEKQTLERVSISGTKEATNIQSASVTQFRKIETPLSANENYCIRAMREQAHFITHDFVDILNPPFSKEECYSLQKAGEIQTSIVFPVMLKGKSIGIIIFSTKHYIDTLTEREIHFITSLSNLIGIAVENSNLFKALEKEKLQLEKANIKLQRLDQAKDEFISITSHELKTPMTIIKSYLWMLQTERSGNLTEKQKSYVEKAVKGTERMIALINDILNISRVEQGRMEFKIEPINISDFMNDIKDEIEIKAKEKDLYFEVDIKGVSVIYADKEKVREILINLVGNAVKFTQIGGIKIRIAPTINENYAKISVIDTGPGIEKDQLDKLFQKFHRVDSSYQTMAETGGTGLGLYIVKTYVQKMKGEVGVNSEGLDKGSTFWVALPTKPQERL